MLWYYMYLTIDDPVPKNIREEESEKEKYEWFYGHIGEMINK